MLKPDGTTGYNMGRIANAWNAFRGVEKKDSRTGKVIAVDNQSGNVPPQRNYDEFARETYLKNVIAFACITEIAKSCAIPKWKVCRNLGDGEYEDVDDHIMCERLNRPNPTDSWSFFVLSTMAYYMMAGNAFIERVRPDSGPNQDDVKELYTHRPDRMEILIDPNTGQKTGYKYKVSGRWVKWEVDPVTMQADILQLKMFHPIDDWWGASITETAAREIDSSNAATQWNKNILDNEGKPGMVFTFVGDVDEEFLDNFEQHLKSRAGAKGAGTDLIITGEKGTTAKPYTVNPKDLDFTDGGRELARRIALAYGVPPQMLGIPGDNTYKNMEAARLAFWETTVIYYLNYLKGELNNWLFDEESGLFLNYDLSDVPALAVKRDMLWEKAQSSDFLSINEKREMVGKESWGETGDVILIDSNKIPLGLEISDEDEGAEKFLKEQGYSDSDINELLGYGTENNIKVVK